MTLKETVLYLDKNPANAQLSKQPLPALKQSDDKASLGFMKGIFVNEHVRATTVILQKYQGDDDKLPTPELACRRAAANGNINDVKYLLDHCKVNINSKSSNGLTALDWAIKNGHKEVAETLSKIEFKP